MGEHPSNNAGHQYMTAFMSERPPAATAAPHYQIAQAVSAMPLNAKGQAENHADVAVNEGQPGVIGTGEQPRHLPAQWYQPQFDQEHSQVAASNTRPAAREQGPHAAAARAQVPHAAATRQPSSRRRSSRRPAPQSHRNAAAAKRQTTKPGGSARAVQSRSVVNGSGAKVIDPRSSVLSDSLDPRIAKMLDASKTRMLLASEIRSLLLYEGQVLERPSTDTPDWAIYRECPKQRRRARNSDRWANSGGMKGSRDLPYNSSTPYVRRRYGSVFVHKDTENKGKRYYEYTLLSIAEDGSLIEDKTKTLFHILPSPGETDRGRRVTTEDAPRATNETSTSANRGRNSRDTRIRQDVRTTATLAPTPQAKHRGRSVPAQGHSMPRAGAPALGPDHVYTADIVAHSLPGSRPAKSEETNVFSPPAPVTDLAYSQQHSQHRHPRNSMSTHRTESETAGSIAAHVPQLTSRQYERDPVAVKHQLIQQTFSFEEPLPKRTAWSNQGLPGRAYTWEGSSLDHAPISSSDAFGTEPGAWMNPHEWNSGAGGQSDFDSQYQQMAEQNFTTLLQDPNEAESDQLPKRLEGDSFGGSFCPFARPERLQCRMVKMEGT